MIKKTNLTKTELILGVLLIITFFYFLSQQPKTTDIGIKVHFIKDGEEVYPQTGLFTIIDPPGIDVDFIYFDIFGKNKRDISISNIQIGGGWPIELENALNESAPQSLEAGEEKLLWQTDWINVTLFEKYEQPIIFSLNFSGYDTFYNITRSSVGESVPVNIAPPTLTILVATNYPTSTAWNWIGSQWKYPERVYVSDDDYAIITRIASEPTFRTVQDFLNYGFDIPSNATIKGIEVIIEGYCDEADKMQARFALAWDQVPGSMLETRTAWKDSEYWNTTEANYTIGGRNDTWGRNWTVDEISNNVFFRTIFGQGVVSDVKSINAYVDSISVKVYYTE